MLLAVLKHYWTARPRIGCTAILADLGCQSVVFVDPASQIGCDSGVQRSIVTSYYVQVPHLFF